MVIRGYDAWKLREPEGHACTEDVLCTTCKVSICATCPAVKACDCCNVVNTCYGCMEDVQMLGGMKCCAECIAAFKIYDTPANCIDCGEVGITGEMVKGKNGLRCENCALFASGLRMVLAEVASAEARR